MTAKQQKNQMKLAFSAEGRGEAPKAAGGGTEVVRAGYGTESPASPECLMEEVCQRDNLMKALKRVKANQGSPGIDGMRVAELVVIWRPKRPAAPTARGGLAAARPSASLCPTPILSRLASRL